MSEGRSCYYLQSNGRGEGLSLACLRQEYVVFDSTLDQLSLGAWSLASDSFSNDTPWQFVGVWQSRNSMQASGSGVFWD